MFSKKIKKVLVATCMMTAMFSSQVFASSYVSGTSSGGSLGTASCNGSISTSYNSATGATNTNTTSGTKDVTVTIHYDDNSSESQDFSGYASSVSGTVSGVYWKSKSYASARHSFSSSQYGSWYGSTSTSF